MMSTIALFVTQCVINTDKNVVVLTVDAWLRHRLKSDRERRHCDNGSCGLEFPQIVIIVDNMQSIEISVTIL